MYWSPPKVWNQMLPVRRSLLAGAEPVTQFQVDWTSSFEPMPKILSVVPEASVKGVRLPETVTVGEAQSRAWPSTLVFPSISKPPKMHGAAWVDEQGSKL